MSTDYLKKLIHKYQDGGVEKVEPKHKSGSVDDISKPTGIIHIKYQARGRPEEILEVHPFPDNPYMLYNRSAIFYGPSGSGKTYLIKHFMYKMRHMFPIVMGFLPTNFEKHDFENIIPRQLIYEEFGAEDIYNVYMRQKAASDVFTRSNDVKVLKALFIRTNDPAAIRMAQDCEKCYHTAKGKIEKKIKEIPNAPKMLEQIEENYKREVVNLYKVAIYHHRDKLKSTPLSPAEQYVITYLGLNAATLTVFDDATVEMDSIMKEGKKGKKKSKGDSSGNPDSVVQDFFFKGRWSNITHWYAFHDDSGIDTRVRKNAFYSIFTNAASAHGFYARSNGISPMEKKKITAIIDAVFNEEIAPPHAKLIYCRPENRFYYIVAEKTPPFTMCSKMVREFCKQVQGENTTMENNMYVDKFAEAISH